MDRSLRLAALASAAVPGLDPMAVQEVVSADDEHFDVAFIQDTQQRRWVIRAPRDEVSAARMDASLAMLALLHRRVPFAVPAAKGFAPIAKIGRAAVHTYIPGHPLDLAALRPGHPVTSELGRTIALIHNVDRGLFDEAGLASYDAEAYRRRHLAEIDRGAATGRVPSGLLARWEEALDDVRLWRFAPTPVHGALSGSDVLVAFPDPTDPSRATIRGVTGWEEAKVADPADDFAALVALAAPEVVDSVLTAYAHVRVERPDEHLLARARLVSELALLASLLGAVKSRDEVTTEATTARLRRLDDTVHSERQARRLRIVPSGSGSADGTASAAAASAPSGTAPSAPTGRPETPRRSGVIDQDDDATDVIDMVDGEVPAKEPGDSVGDGSSSGNAREPSAAESRGSDSTAGAGGVAGESPESAAIGSGGTDLKTTASQTTESQTTASEAPEPGDAASPNATTGMAASEGAATPTDGTSSSSGATPVHPDPSEGANDAGEDGRVSG
ncbi:phosphotransferase [Nostocoides sp. F2B08]|uniref:phosphotransferase n=1 Tax=Nostocoides sp. F2B08 TaxID=2653936 RepID=UPI00126381D4|nr:phosphotransferase [Tetrasphaera sp. F2B08]KAB7746215.1 phosphotransferase [Tetrasphaera sp. F2B08]